MKCLNLHAVGDLRLDEKEIPQCGKDEVLVKIESCGICGSDIGRVFKSGTYHFPTVIGHEFSGLVVGDESGEWLNKRVAVFPLLPCFTCDMCVEGRYAQCRDYDYYGSRRDGGFAEYLAVKKWNLIELPEGVSFEEGAMCEPTSVGLHAVKKLGDIQGQSLLVTGAGPIGIIVGLWAKKYGVKDVYFIDIDERKLDFAEKFGFMRYDGQEVQCCVEGTGASSAITTAITALQAFGKMVLMGNPGGDVQLTAKNYQNILRKELTVLGTWNSQYSDTVNDWKDALKAVSEGNFPIARLITHRPTLDECLDTFDMIKERQEFYCKVVAHVDE